MKLTAFGPDFPFAYDDWINHPDGLGSIPESAHGKRVAIVGAGVAGLVCAYELMKLGLKPVIYESTRIGGRLRTEPFETAPGVFAELGGMRFPRSSTALFTYVDDLGLTTKPFPNPLTEAAPSTIIDLDGRSHHAKLLDDLPQLFKDIAKAWDDSLENECDLSGLHEAMRKKDAKEVSRRWHEIIHRWDDHTFYDFLASAHPFCELSFRHREVFGQVGFGTGGWDSDYPNSMLEILRVVVDEFEEDQHLIVEGAEEIVRRLWEKSPAELTHWAPGTSVSSLNGGATRPGVKNISAKTVDGEQTGGFEITDRWGNTDTFDALLVTTQSWLLTTSLGLEEELLPHSLWMALDRTRYMKSSKTFVMVDRPFWKDIDPETGNPYMSMTLTDRNTRGTYLFDNGPDKPAVICLSYAWAADASKVLAKTPSERAEMALSTLDKIYPTANLRSHVLGEPITVSWEADPDFLGAFKGALPGHYRYNRRMYGHFMQRELKDFQRGLFLAGDDVSWTPGWAEGAVQTALNATWGIMTHFGGQTHESNPGPGDVWDECGPLDLDALDGTAAEADRRADELS